MNDLRSTGVLCIFYKVRWWDSFCGAMSQRGQLRSAF